MKPDQGGRSALGRALRFLVVGGLNTLGTYAIFFLLGLVIPPWIAYTVAFGLGLLWTSLASSRLVFRVRFRVPRVAAFAAFYLVVYGLGRLVIHLLDPQGPEALLVTAAVVLVVTTPLAFLGGHLIFRPDSPAPEGQSST